MERYEEYIEERDLDDDVDLKKRLILSVKELSENEDLDFVFKQIRSLQKQYKRIPNYESALDEQLQQEFEGYVDMIYAKRNELYKQNANSKMELINKAKSLLNPINYNQASSEMNELMKEWKTVGSASKDVDDELWAQFNEVRQSFYGSRQEHFEVVKEKQKASYSTKKEIVEKAKELESSEDWKTTTEAFKQLFINWKEAGNAGKEENALWKAFNDSYHCFVTKRNAYYDELHEVQAQRAVKKQEIIAQAKTIVDAKQYTKENTNIMKNMTATWKEIGSAGKEENALWNELRTVLDAYFAGLKQANEERQNQWRQKMLDAKAHKAEIIMNQTRQIKRLQQDMPFMYSERQMAEANEEIAEKQEFIAELEAQIAEIEAKLNNNK